MADARADRDLWASGAGGDADAFGELFRRHARAIYNFCFRRTGAWSTAEDLASVVFLEAWRRRRSLMPYGTSALPLLYGIALRVTHNHRRSLRRYQAALDRVPPTVDEPDPADDVSERIDAARRMLLLRQALDLLPRRDREVVELCSWTELSQRQVAEVLGVPLGTVKSRLARAQQRLARYLTDLAALADPPPADSPQGGR